MLDRSRLGFAKEIGILCLKYAPRHYNKRMCIMQYALKQIIAGRNFIVKVLYYWLYERLLK